MKNAGKLNFAITTEREIEFERVFDAPRERVFAALIQPASLERWLLGPPGWTMVVCKLDPKVGGAYRYAWRRDGDGTEMGMGGELREFVRPERLVATERFDKAWYPGEALVTQVLAERAGKTTLTMTVRYESRKARDVALETPMADGMAASYDRLEALLAATNAR